MKPRLKVQYNDEIKAKIAETFGVKNIMALPRLEKIVLSVGLGKQLEGTKIKPAAREQVIKTLAMVTGQAPVMKKAKKSVSNFKLRAGYEVGAMVTLRGDRMWEFLDRLINLSIPRIKDFRGLSDKSFDGRGNYNFGIQEQAIFPEVDMANASFTHGMNITMVFKNSTDDQSREVLKQLGMPFAKKEKRN
ncbi:50S ribosomal protein L5 [Poriferisphaera corsica]|uniref:Large ribosomal subunit protein uL5 n=1 Tax=Poriferisphaera corsica TaxID=2528020 RepID=A0A517YT23_9BACT|nr:50S ribosomal protein L5 [Poriferisphaera corsica]QDU33364.1 50S ribosomal protein L5 [Poriferisphaera corsica]